MNLMTWRVILEIVEINLNAFTLLFYLILFFFSYLKLEE